MRTEITIYKVANGFIIGGEYDSPRWVVNSVYSIPDILLKIWPIDEPQLPLQPQSPNEEIPF